MRPIQIRADSLTIRVVEEAVNVGGKAVAGPAIGN